MDEEYEKRCREVQRLGFCFENDEIFHDFLKEIQQYSTNAEKNCYHAFIHILTVIAKYKMGVFINPMNKGEGKVSGLPATGGRYIKVKFKPELNKNTSKQQYKIIEVKIENNAKLSKDGNSRY